MEKLSVHFISRCLHFFAWLDSKANRLLFFPMKSFLLKNCSKITYKFFKNIKKTLHLAVCVASNVNFAYRPRLSVKFPDLKNEQHEIIFGQEMRSSKPFFKDVIVRSAHSRSFFNCSQFSCKLSLLAKISSCF